nr:hypothetical protein [Pseudomonas syringae pv. actinidiae]
MWYYCGALVMRLPAFRQESGALRCVNVPKGTRKTTEDRYACDIQLLSVLVV